MRVAIVGSRAYPDLERVREYVRQLPDDTLIISGGARGVDSVAVNEAWRRGLISHEYYADWEKHGKAAGPIRNQWLVDLADRVVAFWDGKSRGTRDAIARARKAGKPVEVIGP